MYLTNTSIFNILNTLLYNALRQNVFAINFKCFKIRHDSYTSSNVCAPLGQETVIFKAYFNVQ